MVEHDPDFWPTIEEAELMLLHSQLHWAQEDMKLLEIEYVGQDLTGIYVACDGCYEIFLASDSVFEKIENTTHMKCPKCLLPFKELQEPK